MWNLWDFFTGSRRGPATGEHSKCQCVPFCLPASSTVTRPLDCNQTGTSLLPSSAFGHFPNPDSTACVSGSAGLWNRKGNQEESKSRGYGFCEREHVYEQELIVPFGELCGIFGEEGLAGGSGSLGVGIWALDSTLLATWVLSAVLWVTDEKSSCSPPLLSLIPFPTAKPSLSPKTIACAVRQNKLSLPEVAFVCKVFGHRGDKSS